MHTQAYRLHTGQSIGSFLPEDEKYRVYFPGGENGGNHMYLERREDIIIDKDTYEVMRQKRRPRHR
ncbi:hypothetical protein AALA00_13925 [Lachnospiraceae bacterium 46-15]